MAAAAKTSGGKKTGGKTGEKAGGKRAAKRGRVTAAELEGRSALAQEDDSLDADARSRLEESLIAQPVEPDAPPADDDEPIETIDASSGDIEPPAEDLGHAPGRRGGIPSVGAPVAPPIVRSDHVVVYGPDRSHHMSEMGPVCTTNWIGRVNGFRVSVRFGAPLSTIPTSVRQALAGARIRFAYAAPPRDGGARRIPAEPPRARRRGAKGEDTPRARPFRSVQGLHSRP